MLKQVALVIIAAVTHEANRQYCISLGDHSQPHWEEAPEWQKNSAIEGVLFRLMNPTAGPEASHDSWFEQKRLDGWKYGPVKKPETKEHPCFVGYEELPADQRRKDHIFMAVVAAMTEALNVHIEDEPVE